MDSKPYQEDSEEVEQFDLASEFTVYRFDKDDDAEKKWKFRQEDYDQGLIANEALVGKEYQMNNGFPLALRLARFAPNSDHFIYQVRKATAHPWSVEDTRKSKNQKLYVPSEKEEVHDFTPTDSQTPYQIRVTDMIGPKKAEFYPDVDQFPADINSLKTSEEELKKCSLKKVEWREYYGNGVMEGLKFHWENGQSTNNYGESKRYPNEKSTEGFDDKIKVIKVTYCEDYCTGIEFYNFEGQVGSTIGKPKANGARGEITEEFIGLKPGERIVGFKLQEGKDNNDPHAFMIGKIAFILAGPAQTQGTYHWSYSLSVKFQDAANYIKQVGGQLLTTTEAKKFIEENGVLFPGEDQWAAVITEDGEKNWIQLGDQHHTPGRLHSDFGYPGWGDKSGHFVWRQCMIWKDADGSAVEPKWKEEVEKVEEEDTKNPYPDPKNLFLSTIRVFKYSASEEPSLVKEILAENNLYPAMDYGPSVAFFEKNMYYFKRVIMQKEYSVLQMFKYNFDSSEESPIEGIFFKEDNEDETKIQFIEQTKVQAAQYTTEAEFLNNTFVTRQSTIKEPWKKEISKSFMIFKLGNIDSPIFNSNDVKCQYISKLAMWKDEENQQYTFRVYSVHMNRTFTVPIQDGTVECNSEEYKSAGKLKVISNPNDYHQDWPFDLREATIKLNGEKVMVQYFLVLSGDKGCEVELVAPVNLSDTDVRKVKTNIMKKISAGMYEGGSFNQDVTTMDRIDGDDNVIFPAVVPRKFIGQIFEGHQGMDAHRKVYESSNQRSIILYCLAGRDILVATLKADSKFKTVQEAFASTGFDPTSNEKKIANLTAQVKMLQKLVGEQSEKIEAQNKRIEALESKN